MDFYFKLPPVTRTLVLLITVCSIGAAKGPVPLQPLAFIPSKFFPQIWRPVTSFFIAGFPQMKLMNIVFDVYMTYMNSIRCESSFRTPGDYTIFLSFVGTVLIAISLVTYPTVFFLDRLIIALAYYSCMKASPGERAGIYFLQVPIRYYPLCLLGLVYLQSESVDAMLAAATGIVAGHAYLYLTDIVPMFTGRPLTWFNAPRWLESVFMHPFFSENVPGVAAPPAEDPELRRGGGPKFEGAGGTANWRQRGKGRRLVD